MTWILNGEHAPRDPGNGRLLIDGVQYPHDWPHADLEALGLTWVEPELAPPDWPALATRALEASDRTAVRTLKLGLAYPVEWQAYDEALRAIVNGADGPLPDRPVYPE